MKGIFAIAVLLLSIAQVQGQIILDQTKAPKMIFWQRTDTLEVDILQKENVIQGKCIRKVYVCKYDSESKMVGREFIQSEVITDEKFTAIRKPIGYQIVERGNLIGGFMKIDSIAPNPTKIWWYD